MPVDQLEANLDLVIDNEVNSLPSDAIDPLTRYSRAVDDPCVKAWLRLPNIYQQEKIRAKALAARARFARFCRDRDSDQAMSIEARLEPFDSEDDDSLKRFLMSQHMAECARSAAIMIETSDREKHPQWAEFKNVQEHAATLNDEAESANPDPQVVKVCEEILERYAHALRDVARELMDPFEIKYDAMNREALMDSLFRLYAKQGCDQEYLRVYNEWQMFFGTRHPDEHNRSYWKDIDAMLDEQPEVLEVIAREFEILELETVAASEAKKAPAATSSSPSSDSAQTGE